MAKTTTWQIPYPDLASPADIQGVDGVDDLAIRVDACLTQVRAQGAIPGEMKMWPGPTLPAQATYGHWVWADGGAYDSATYPLASANISPNWKTFGGLADPGAGKFRVPDMRGVLPAGMDAMPGGARANRITRATATTLAGRTGEEYHTLGISEIAAHAHTVNDPGHTHSINDVAHTHSVADPYHTHPSLAYPAAGGGASGVTGFSMTTASNQGNIGTSQNPTGITLYGSGTGIGIYAVGTGITTLNNGSGGAHENLPPTVFVPYIVKLDD